jgi:hypothetical protein
VLFLFEKEILPPNPSPKYENTYCTLSPVMYILLSLVLSQNVFFSDLFSHAAGVFYGQRYPSSTIVFSSENEKRMTEKK